MNLYSIQVTIPASLSEFHWDERRTFLLRNLEEAGIFLKECEARGYATTALPRYIPESAVEAIARLDRFETNVMLPETVKELRSARQPQNITKTE